MPPLRGTKRKRRDKSRKSKPDPLTLVPDSGDWWDTFSRRISVTLSIPIEKLEFEMVLKMPRRTFNYICSLVRDILMTKNTHYLFVDGTAMAVEDQVAVALRRLSSGDSLVNVGTAFGTNHSTVSQVRTTNTVPLCTIPLFQFLNNISFNWKPSELINIKSVIHNQVPVIRRFTGGGTVIVDKETIFVTLICNREAVPLLQLYPQPIMSWTGTLYQDALRDFGKFSLRENDYVFDNLKFGGNAQSITKNKWIHHTSFLWNYDVRNMDYLKHPQRTPKYRSERSHIEFLCRMKDIIPSKSVFIEKTLNSLQKHFVLQPIKSDDISNAPYAPSSRLLTRQELEHDLLSTGT
ncbi:putative lipoate-protein ligase A isoform X2 [Carex littledalei]|uniref:Putative lipoate-protein ligase A isoform X2 n=1 Tax=Carex littledalei TaxID=544730 RepID=A0A833R5B4_9POAL|nr:putative lipoate-protein ligase A isoform X2 [Carex littledalei]